MMRWIWTRIKVRCFTNQTDLRANALARSLRDDYDLVGETCTTAISNPIHNDWAITGTGQLRHH